jgi:hypothetical protein
MLAAHSAITSFPETHFFNHIHTDDPLRRLSGRVSAKARQRVRPFFEDLEGQFTLPASDSAAAWIQWWVDQLDSVAESRDAGAWLEKTPSHLERIETIEKHIPDAKFIHLVRNGVDTVASLYAVTHDHPQNWGGVRDLDTCIDRWIRSVRLTARWCFEPNHTVAHYATLVDNPDLTLRLLCRFLGISFEPSMRSDFQSAATSVIEDSEEWKASNRRPLENKKREKFEARLDEAQQRHVIERLRAADVPWPVF